MPFAFFDLSSFFIEFWPSLCLPRIRPTLLMAVLQRKENYQNGKEIRQCKMIRKVKQKTAPNKGCVLTNIKLGYVL